jgi:hypothetical protein
VDIKIASLNQIDGDIKMVLDDGKPLTGEIALANLAPNNWIDVASASGSANFTTDGEVDISKLASVLSGQADMQGQAKLAVKVDAQPEQFGVNANVSVMNLISPQMGGKPLNLTLTGDGGLAGETLSANVQLDGSSTKFLVASATGSTSDLTVTFNTNLTQLRQELGQAIDLGDLEFSGQADGNVHLTEIDSGGYNTDAKVTIKQAAFRSGAQDLSVADVQLTQTGTFGTSSEAVRSTGELILSNVLAGGKPLDQRAEVRWKDLAFGSELTAETVNVKATPLTLDAQGLRVDIDAGAVDGGDLKLNANLAKTMQLVAAVSGMEEPPAIAGQFDLAAQATSDSGGQKLSGSGAITQLVVGEGESAIREDRLDLVLNAQLDTSSSKLTLGENRIRSEKLTLDVQGNISDYTGKAVADITGQYDLSWPAITALLHELSPGTKDVISISGQSSSPITLKGPLNDPSAKPSFRGLNAGLALTWDQLDLYGIPISAATFEPKLADAQITLPASTLSAVQGKVTLGAEVDFKPEDMTLRMPGTTKVLDGVQVTTELTQELLSRINPIFYQFVDATGQINLTIRDLVLPMGESIKQDGTGGGVLELVEMKVKPGGLVRDLVTLGGLGDADELLAVKLKGGDFEVADGRIAYDEFTLIFPSEFDVKFYGSVAFDDTLDLVVSIPIRADLLRKLGVSGDVQKYAEMLDGTRVDVPLSGTRQQPKLNLAKVDTQKLMEGVMKGAVEGEGKKLLEGLMGGGEKKDGDTKSGEDDKKKNNPLGGLMDQLQGDKKK